MKKVTIALAALIMLGTADAYAQRKMPVNAKGKPGTSKGKTASKKSKRRGYDEGKKFNISIGLSLATSNTVTTKLSDASGSATITRSGGPAIGVFVYPKFHVYSAEKFSISVGVPLTIAFSGSSNSRTGVDEGSTSFLYDLPLMIDFNGGVMTPAGRYGDSRFGYFAGVGIGIENTDASYAYVGNGYTGKTPDYTKAKSVGPNVHVGGVFRLGSEERPRFVGVRLSYKIGLNSDKFNYFTPSVFLNI
jgi:hypothetical protein